MSRELGIFFILPRKTNVFGGILESACLSVCLSVHVSVCVQNTRFCQSAGGGIKSHLVTALVFLVLILLQYIFFNQPFLTHGVYRLVRCNGSCTNLISLYLWSLLNIISFICCLCSSRSDCLLCTYGAY